LHFPLDTANHEIANYLIPYFFDNKFETAKRKQPPKIMCSFIVDTTSISSYLYRCRIQLPVGNRIVCIAIKFVI